MNVIVRPLGLNEKTVPVNNRVLGRIGGKRLAGPSRRSPLPSARTKKMPSPVGGRGAGGYGDNRFVTSKTTPEPSGSTPMCWKTPASMENTRQIVGSPKGGIPWSRVPVLMAHYP